MYNKLKMFVFLSLIVLAFMALGFALFGDAGMIVGLCLSVIGITLIYWFADRIILSLHRAEEVPSSDSYGVHGIVERLAQRAQIAKPRIYLIPDHSPNAFSTGRNQYHASLAVTQGLLGLLSQDEIEGVLAHEIAHIKRKETGLSSLTAALTLIFLSFVSPAGWKPFFGEQPKSTKKIGAFRWLIAAIFSPIGAFFTRLTIPKTREFLADETAVKLSGNPVGLATALRKIQTVSIGLPLADGRPATAHLYIVNPYHSVAMTELFFTHPPIEERIERLLEV